MNLHEYQAKQVFQRFGIPVNLGKVAYSAEEAAHIAVEFSQTNPVMVIKAQVHAGGRGKAGLVKLVKKREDAKAAAADIIGKPHKGYVVNKVLVDPGVDIRKELYFAITNDRTARKPLFMVSAEGGMDIEEVNAVSPGKIIKIHVDPLLGLLNYQIVQMAKGIGLPKEHWKQFNAIAHALYRCYRESDATLCEINPLAIVGKADGSTQLMALDGKMSLDDNGLFRQHDLEVLRDVDAEPTEETQAREAALSYVKLEGQIGCMVNGAGLAMTTMDMVGMFGEADGIGPANFLDIGGGAGADKVAAALKIILADPNVKAILLNIFGGITRCDDVARGVLQALEAVPTELPFIVRLVGTNQEEGLRIINEAQLKNLTGATSLYEAAQKAVAAVKGAN